MDTFLYILQHLAYLAIYGGLHVYLYAKLQRAFPRLRIPPGAVFWTAFLVIVINVLYRLLRDVYPGWVTRSFSFLSYSYIILFIWTAGFHLLLDGWNLLLKKIASRSPLALSRQWGLVAGLVLLALGLGIWEGRQLHVQTIPIAAPQMPAGHPPLRILFISDLHLGYFQGEGRLQMVLDKAQALRPHLILEGGDLFERPPREAGNLLPLLQRLKAPLGKIAVTGNHEWYIGIEQVRQFYAEAGYRLLEGEWRNLTDWLRVGGIDDWAGRHVGGVVDEDLALRPHDPERFTILLKHRPFVKVRSTRWMDLQLSGHTHGGQVFPIGLLYRLFGPWRSGLNKTKKDRLLYISRGAGMGGLPIRLFCPAEINLIILHPPEGGDKG